MKRRDFLACTAALSAAVLRPSTCRAVGDARVVVIGGGYGGATAARYLKLISPTLHVTLVTATPHHRSCPGSNEVIAGLRSAAWLDRGYDRLARSLAISVIEGTANDLDRAGRQVILADGRRIPFDRLVLSPGINFRWNAWAGYDEAASRSIPHGWIAGPQTDLLSAQLRSMRRGGLFVIVAPPNPYRCPPGPYERASLAAHFLKRHNPRAKVLILDPKTQFSKQTGFTKGWQDFYPGMIEWKGLSSDGAIDHIDVRTRTVHLDFAAHKADVLNVIPPQKAGELAERLGLVDSSGWCPVDPRCFTSTLNPLVHVIGDACAAAPMPKSAFSANSQAKVAAAAIVDRLEGRTPEPPTLINHCYSFLTPEDAISVTGVYQYSDSEKGLIATVNAETPADGDRRLEARMARAWQRNFAHDCFGA